MSHILHINDNNLIVQSTEEAGNQAVLHSQGYAWLKGDEVLFDLNHDEKPLKHCRLSPQQINHRYWQQCAQTAISSNGAGMRHAADLIWKHLAELKSKLDLTRLALVVPANYRDTHLQLLLGVAKACDLEVTALISKPVLAATQADLAIGPALHIDVQLHQTVISSLNIGADEVTLQDVDIKSDLGLHSLQESLLHVLQESFIRTDRFDPLHDADTEQQLFDQLPNIVNSAIRSEKANVGVQHQGKLYNTTVERNEIEAALSDVIGLIRQHASPSLMVDMNAEFELASLPGLSPDQMWWSTEVAPVSEGLANSKNELGKVIYQTSLANTSAKSVTKAPVKSSPAPVNAQSQVVNNGAVQESQIATHLMQFGVVVPLSQALVDTQDAVLTLQQTATPSDITAMLSDGKLQVINDKARKQLQANDRLMSPMANGVITAVKVV